MYIKAFVYLLVLAAAFTPYKFVNASWYNFFGSIVHGDTNIVENEVSLNSLVLDTKSISFVEQTGGEDLNYELKDLSFVPDTLPAGLYHANSYSDKGSNISTYIVKNGDTLSEIAEKFDVSVNTIIWANQVSRTKSLKVGSEIIILPVTGVVHEVKSRDTIASISKQYNAKVDDIINFNNLTENQSLTIGQKIIIPDGEMKTISPSVSKSISSESKSSTQSSSKYYMKPTSGPKTQGLHGHNGKDFGGHIGDAVNAAASGKVIIAKTGWNGGYGNYVVIEHPNGQQTLYGHMSKITISSGDIVSQGQRIGSIGNTGQSTGPHLHFEVHGGSNPF